MRVLFTGSRHFSDRELLLDTIAANVPAPTAEEPHTFVHGDCPTGLDAMVASLNVPFLTIEAHPADWDKHGKAAGPIRNDHMVDLGADLCLAFPTETSRGTIHCMHSAVYSGIPVVIGTHIE